MSLEQLQELIASTEGIRLCEICGLPYKPYHSRQRSCGSRECKTELHRRYSSEYRAKKISEDHEKWKSYRREVVKRYRNRLKHRDELDEQFEENAVQEFEKAQEPNLNLDHYAQRQREKTLASVPKIDLTQFEKQIQERKDNGV